MRLVWVRSDPVLEPVAANTCNQVGMPSRVFAKPSSPGLLDRTAGFCCDMGFPWVVQYIGTCRLYHSGYRVLTLSEVEALWFCRSPAIVGFTPEQISTSVQKDRNYGTAKPCSLFLRGGRPGGRRRQDHPTSWRQECLLRQSCLTTINTWINQY